MARAFAEGVIISIQILLVVGIERCGLKKSSETRVRVRVSYA